MRRPSFPTVISLIALFVALGGTSYAVIKLPANSVGSREIRNKSVRPSDLAPSARIGRRGSRGPEGPAGPAGPSAAAVEAWKPLQFVGSWTSYGEVWPDAAYRKDAAGRVYLRGLVKETGAPTGADTIAVLPPGYAPRVRLMFTVFTQGGTEQRAGRVDITPGGEIGWAFGPSADPDYTSLDGISFWTD